jgi:hypothetical protein
MSNRMFGRFLPVRRTNSVYRRISILPCMQKPSNTDILFPDLSVDRLGVSQLVKQSRCGENKYYVIGQWSSYFKSVVLTTVRFKQ